MHQAAFPGEDISDRPLPEEAVPGFIELIQDPNVTGRQRVRSTAVPAAQQAPV
jgi:hypothetical protein